jgi:uncharacterized protein
MNTLTQRTHRQAGSAFRAAAQPFMNPYAAGVLLGLVLLATYAISGRGLGATAGFAAIATSLAGLLTPTHIETSVVHAKYWNEGAPLVNWTLVLLVGSFVGAAVSGWQARRFSLSIERGPHISDGQRLVLAFVGGFVAALGAKLAKGCTSGQALTGSAVLNVGGLVFLCAVFAGAFGLAYFVRKEWL